MGETAGATTDYPSRSMFERNRIGGVQESLLSEPEGVQAMDIALCDLDPNPDVMKGLLSDTLGISRNFFMENNPVIVYRIPTDYPASGIAEPRLSEEYLSFFRPNTTVLWNDVVGQTLDKWLRDPEFLDDDDMIVPCGEVIQLARQIAIDLLEHGDKAPPTSIVPDGDGGVILERLEGESIERIVVRSDHSAEYQVIVDDRVVVRETWLM